MRIKFTSRWAIGALLLAFSLTLNGYHARSWQMGVVQPAYASESLTASNFYYLPTIIGGYPWQSPFGVEVSTSLAQDTVTYSRMVDLNARWVRLNNRISWRQLQPQEGGPIQWGLLAGLEVELRALQAAHVTPLIITDDYPTWAVEIKRSDGKPSSCGPLKSTKYQAFAQFMRQIVAHFKTGEFNVHNWELGNEPDVDPALVPLDSVYGCWGEIHDPYYGGEQYGEMLKVTAPVLRAEDPDVKIWMGGLLLGTPHTTDPSKGHPELFFEGVLRSGAANSFDVVPYHWYAGYQNTKIDHDLQGEQVWASLGGGTVGKARFLRSIMGRYQVSKPLSVNEIGLHCPEYSAWCKSPNGPTTGYYQAQADHLVRSFVRGLNEKISSFFWFTLDGPGWRYSSLLDNNQNPKPNYAAYRVLASQLQGTHLINTVSYGQGIEAYAFQRGAERVDVIWTVADVSIPISIPQGVLKAAFDRDGNALNLPLQGDYYTLTANFSPVYLVRLP
jgi:hypothetical protein